MLRCSEHVFETLCVCFSFNMGVCVFIYIGKMGSNLVAYLVKGDVWSNCCLKEVTVYK